MPRQPSRWLPGFRLVHSERSEGIRRSLKTQGQFLHSLTFLRQTYRVLSDEDIKKALKKTYSFTLAYKGASDLTPELCDAIFEAGCDDALLPLKNDEVTLDFDREAEDFRDALQSAILAVEGAGAGLTLIRVEPS